MNIEYQYNLNIYFNYSLKPTSNRSILKR